MMFGLGVLLSLVLLEWLSVASSSKPPSSLTTNSSTSCPQLCSCFNGSVSCSAGYFMMWSQFLSTIPQDTESISISGGLIFFQDRGNPDSIILPLLTQIHITASSIPEWDPKVFAMTPNVSLLHLSKLNFAHQANLSFTNLTNLEYLHVIESNLTTLDDEAFVQLDQLRELNLSSNSLTQLSASLLAGTLQLELIDLSFNLIEFIDPELTNLTSLSYLNVQHNRLKWIPEQFLQGMNSSEILLDIVGNPWACNCGIRTLMDGLLSFPHLFPNYKELQCHSPENFLNIPLMLLDPSRAKCQPPSFDVTPSNETVIHHMYQAVLHCNASGAPTPNIYWISPRGVLAHPKHKQWMTKHHIDSKQKLTFAGKPSFYKAEVEVAENGDLVFRQFRFFFAGEYKCVAENPGGVESVSVNVAITKDSFSRTVITSIVYGFIIAGCVSTLGVIIGFIRFAAERWICKPDPELVDVYTDDDWMDIPTPGTEPFHPWHMPWVWSPNYSREHSPQKCVTPATPATPDEGATAAEGYDQYDGEPGSSHILEQLEDVRALLRHSMQRSMVKLRSASMQVRQTSTRKLLCVRESSSQRLQTIRESSTRRLHNIRSSSSNYITHFREHSTKRMRNIRSSTGQYVTRMRTGVNIGMESMRSNILSMREFCGPGGDLAHTVSTVSVATNVDSQVSTQVVKTVTYV
ncbi:hypothetical protein CAPTEDRAFT_212723 [Capitella teleta]|uniref:Ig-like domain-containing protein n=1 Tax=Capitella teleta TaxID=283909 RepID=R7UJ67_CAPTE|nr:hypothetical protein CAPTEDRAFT_212723 [Capitella teleta]|eukprot:ELU06123.1 hypothetical protein CAPTEDRAFT_212723 [Capitella teleta]